jgi:hypothetical protein
VKLFITSGINCGVIGSPYILDLRLKMAVFWVVAPCALMMEAASTSEASVNFHQTTRRYNPEDSHLHTRRRENLISYLDLRLPLENDLMCCTRIQSVTIA